MCVSSLLYFFSKPLIISFEVKKCLYKLNFYTIKFYIIKIHFWEKVIYKYSKNKYIAIFFPQNAFFKLRKFILKCLSVKFCLMTSHLTF